MSPKAISPTTEETLAILAERLRHLETDDKWQFGEIRNARHYSVGSATGGAQEGLDILPTEGGEVYLPPTGDYG